MTSRTPSRPWIEFWAMLGLGAVVLLPPRARGEAPKPEGAASRPQAGRRLQAYPRTAEPFHARTFRDAPTGEEFLLVTGGIKLIITDPPAPGTMNIRADRLVLSAGKSSANPLRDRRHPVDARPAPAAPLELYLEGNVVVVQNEREIRATQMYLDVAANDPALAPTPTQSAALQRAVEALRQPHTRAAGSEGKLGIEGRRTPPEPARLKAPRFSEGKLGIEGVGPPP